MPVSEPLSLTPTEQAGRILAAWASGNKPRLQQELRNSRQLGGGSQQPLDEERLELLQAVSEGMLRAPDGGLGRRDPAVRRCLDLLAHLAQAPAVTATSN